MSETEAYITESAPGGLARMLDYSKRAAKVRRKHPNCLFITDETDLEVALKRYCWGSEQCVEAFPWRLLSFTRTARKDLSFLLGTQWLRENYADLMSLWPATARNARYLYSPAELAEWFRNNLHSTVESVLVPLTLFSTQPDAMRRRFMTLKMEKMQSVYDGGPLAYRANRLSTWDIFEGVSKAARKELGCWFSDVVQKSEQQGVQFHRTKLIPFEVRLPEGMLPRFYTLPEIGGTRDYPTKEVGMTTARSFGWARHEMANRGVRILGYTQGVAVGGPEYDADYENGLLELMTAERFVKLFGVSALKTARWRISRDLTRWSSDKADFGPGLPPKQLSALLGINYISGIQVFR